jgi:hypothetical protein
MVEDRQSVEHRKNTRLRGVFDQAYGIAYQLLDPKQPSHQVTSCA